MSVFQYAAEAYKLLLTLVELIVGALFGPMRYVTLTVLALGLAAGIWLISLHRRRRRQAGTTPRR
jgi:hypothetical protein